MRTKLPFVVLFLIIILSFEYSFAHPSENSPGSDKKFAVVTYVSNNLQERSARAFIKSVRELSGRFAGSKIYIVLGDTENFPCTSLKSENVILLPLEMDPKFRTYPLAFKAFAAAQVEKLVKDKVATLAWFDPATLVLNSLDDLELSGSFKAVVRPVSLVNKIGITPGSEPNDYWEPIYRKFGLDYKKMPAYKTIVDEQDIQPYFNCEIYSVDPKLGILEKWAEAMTEFLNDKVYQENVCTTFTRKLFLHQAILSGLIMSNVEPEEIKSLPLTSGYPFSQHEQLSESKKIKSLDQLSAVIFDYQWENNPKWKDKIPAGESLGNWLTDAYIDYMKLAENLYRIEWDCNSYLVTTNEGSVLIDPAGASSIPVYFKKIIEKYPVKAILLTHAHQDHWDNIEMWRTDPEIPVIAQREFNEYNDYRKRLLPFYTRRGTIWSRKPLTDTLKLPAFNPVKPTITFVDEYDYQLGGMHFKMTHMSGETPDHAEIYIPELNAVFVGDNYYEYFINNATLRGTPTRPIMGYINTLNLALSYKPELFLPGHGEPVVSQGLIQKTVTNLRDVLEYLNDETVKGINEGKDVYTLIREIKLPENLKVNPYFGKVEWTIRGIYYENIGWFDENPSSMYGEPASEIYPDLIVMAGGTGAVLKTAEQYYNDKEYIKVLHLTDAMLKASPGNKPTLEIRLKALQALKQNTINYIEKIWLDYGIRTATEGLENNSNK